MRQIRRSKKFKKDFKKLNFSGKELKLLKDVIQKIAAGKSVHQKFRDHPLIGNWKGYRELHLKPDTILIYKVTRDELRLARIGSHTNLFKKI